MTDQLLQRGDVVACAGRYFIVWRVQDVTFDVFPIRLGSDASAGNFLVPLGDELSAWNISDQRGAVCADERETISSVPPLSVIRVGRCSGGLICRVVGAAARAFATQFFAETGRSECNNNSPRKSLLSAA